MGVMPDVSRLRAALAGRYAWADVRAGWIDHARTRQARGDTRALYGFRFGTDYGAGWMVAASCQMARGDG